MISGKYAKAPLTTFLGCLIFLLVCFNATGCKHDRSGVNSSPQETHSSGPHYAHLFGQRYHTKVDLYLFIFASDPDYKYLGANDSRSKFPPGALPPAINKHNIGRTYGDIKILDIVPAGSELTIEAETHEVTAFSGIRDTSGFPMGFICRLAYNGKQLNGILSEFIQSHKEVSSEIPNQDIDEAIAVKISQ